MDVIERIDSLLKERGWSWYRLASESSLPRSTVTNLSQRLGSPSLATLEGICSALGVTLCEFFAGSDGPVLLTEEEKALLNRWNRLSAQQRETLLALIDTMH